MNKLNKKVEYALMALTVIKDKPAGALTTAKEVVRMTGVPFDATARVLQVMAQQELLKSEQGAQGGYILQKKLADVSLYELIVMILGPLGVAKCLHDPEGCDLKDTCNILNPITQLNEKLTEFYKTISLAEILNSRSPSPSPTREPCEEKL
jgi:Rrf2 family protein